MSISSFIISFIFLIGEIEALYHTTLPLLKQSLRDELL